MPKTIFSIIEKRFTAIRDVQMQESLHHQKHSEQEVARLKKKQEKFELVLDNATDEKLVEKYTKKWSSIEEQIEELRHRAEQQPTTKDDAKELLKKAKLLFEKPDLLRALGDPNIRYLLLAVRT